MTKKLKPKKCLRIGITGGIGSGKTTVCRMFEALGVPVYDADYWARHLIEHDATVRQAVQDIFGPAAYLPDGTYNRSHVAGIVFQNPEKRAALNAAVHPAVEQHSSAWHAEKAAEGYAYTIKEAALMVESGSHQHLDALVVVTAPEALRIRRVMTRDGISEAAVRARMQSQMPEEEKLRVADYLITNDGHQSLARQVWALHRRVMSDEL